MSKLSKPMYLSNDYPDGFICNATKEHGELVLYEDHAEKETETIPCSCVKCLAIDNDFEVKEPVATHRYNVEELIAMNLVGLYELKSVETQIIYQVDKCVSNDIEEMS